MAETEAMLRVAVTINPAMEVGHSPRTEYCVLHRRSALADKHFLLS
jgi:hypothetical protein